MLRAISIVSVTLLSVSMAQAKAKGVKVVKYALNGNCRTIARQIRSLLMYRTSPPAVHNFNLSVSQREPLMAGKVS